MSHSTLKLCSNTVRTSFLDYFSSRSHAIVKSSPVVPYSDNSIAFVNSGMCQFKNIFLGKHPPPHPRVANSQKCIRVGGKHNDLSCAGRDSYHHSFFEMLGNWSFNDYYKKEACQMALDYLTKSPISLPVNQLYFTYFGGSEQYGLPCDDETLNIWLELGVPRSHILKEGMTSNFWEMGNTGPCGYSSEIHFDLKNDPNTALARINKDSPDLLEIWNIVFISHNRVDSQTILPLSKKYIDTGLGFERLVSISQGKVSAYDTDLFTPLLSTITHLSKAPRYSATFVGDTADLDTSYRMLSDYSRMITVCLADNMFPDATPKLRNITRDALLISEDIFKVKNGTLLTELGYQTAEILGSRYPEIPENIKKVQKIISEESRIFDNLRHRAAKDWKNVIKSNPEFKHLNILEEPGLANAIKYLKKQWARELPVELSGAVAFYLYDTLGLSKDTIQNIADAKNIKLNEAAFEEQMKKLKMWSKTKGALQLPTIEAKDLEGLNLTDDSAKYNFHFDTDQDQYIFPKIESSPKAISLGDNIFIVDSTRNAIIHSIHQARVDSIYLQQGSSIGLIFDSTNFYSESGGQIDDRGVITLSNTSSDERAQVEVTKLICVDGKIIHFGIINSNFTLTPDVTSTLEVDADHRQGCMRAHTASHLINVALRQNLTCTYQKSCRVSKDVCAFDFSVYGETLDLENIQNIEAFFRDVIERGLVVSRSHVSSQELQALPHVMVIPGEVYPEDIVLVEIIETTPGSVGKIPEHKVISREPCCGTHVQNTRHIQKCCVVNLKSHNHGVRSIKCLTGKPAAQAIKNGRTLLEECKKLKDMVNSSSSDLNELGQLNQRIKSLRQTIQDQIYELPFVTRKQCESLLTDLSKVIKIKIEENKTTANQQKTLS